MSMKRISCSLLACAALLGVGLGANSAAATTVSTFGGSEYQVVLQPDISWTDARAAAQALGSGWDLATIGSGAENSFIQGLFPAVSDRNHIWLGATDSASEGTWVWVDGTAWIFDDWWSSEPNDQNNEDYLAFDYRTGSWGNTWGWNDTQNYLGGYERAIGFVAERSVPEPASLLLLGIGLAGFGALRRRKT